MGWFAWLFQIAVSALINWLLAPDLDEIESQIQGTLVNKASNIAQIPVIYGKRKVGGTRVFVETSGTDNQYLYIALVLCEGEVNSIGNVWINDELSSASKFSGLVTINKHLGADNQSADTTLTSAPSWTSNHKLSGIAYLGIRLKWDQEVFGSIPTFHAEVEGRKCYDPRDNTGTGGTIYTTNPAICLLDYLRNSRYGKGLPATAFESAVFAGAVGTSSWHTAADLCDETVTPYSGAGSIAKFSCNTALQTDANIMDNVKVLLSGMRGLMPYTQGEYRVVIEDELSGSAVFSFTEDHIIDGISIVGEKKSNRFNRVIATFANPDKNWQLDQIEYPRSGSSTYTTYLSEDNGFDLEKRIHLNTVTSIYQAYNIARTVLKKSRENLRCSFLSTTEALQCAVGDIVTVTHSTPAWTAKPFRLMDIVLRPDGTVTLSLVEHQDNSYVWDDITQVAIIPDTSLPNPSSVLTPTGLSVASGQNYQVTNNDGSTQPRMLIAWTDSTDYFVDHYIIQYGTTSTWDGEIKTDASPIYVSGVISGTAYNIRVKAVNISGVSSAWLTGTHTIANLVGGGAGITTFSQTSTPTANLEAGDLWFDTDNDNLMHRYSGSVWESVQDGSIPTGDLADLNVVTEDEISDGAVTVDKMTVDGKLTINDTTGSFAFKKTKYSDYQTNGVFLGNRSGSNIPVFLAGNNTSYILVDDDGVKIIGASFYDSTTLSTLPALPSVPTEYSTNGVHDFQISSAYASITFELSGAGGGGGGATSGTGVGEDGTAGGNTTVQIFDSNNTEITASSYPTGGYSVNGGNYGAGEYATSSQRTGADFDPLSDDTDLFYGEGGDITPANPSGNYHYDGGNASGQSAGGEGGADGSVLFGSDNFGYGGSAGSYSTPTAYITGSNSYTYYARINIGKGGNGGSGGSDGGKGSDGAVRVSVTLI